MNKPIFRFKFSRFAWAQAKQHYRFLRGYSFYSFWDKGSVSWTQVFGPLFKVAATVDCSTTGGGLYYVDPATIKHPLLA